MRGPARVSRDGNTLQNHVSGSYLTDLNFLGPTEAVANGTFSFTGGTGPFQNASGGGNMMAAIHLATGTSEITIDGRITVPDAGDPLAPAMLSLLGLTFIQRRSRRTPSSTPAPSTNIRAQLPVSTIK